MHLQSFPMLSYNFEISNNDSMYPYLFLLFTNSHIELNHFILYLKIYLLITY